MSNLGNNNNISRRRKAYIIIAAASVLCMQIITSVKASQLNHKINSLETSYDQLSADYKELETNYQQLQNDYEELMISHDELADEVKVIGTSYSAKSSARVSLDESSIKDDNSLKADTPILKPRQGVNQGPLGKETWYDLNMDGVCYLMNDLGYTYEEYPYWVREDGVKMFGDYIMVAADLNIWPKGTILECSLGTAMVVDTGCLEPYQLDIAVDWDTII